MRREESRKTFLESEKLHTMKKIVEYQHEVDSFPQTQQTLLDKIEKGKTNNSLVTDMLAGILADHNQLKQVRDERARLEEEALEAMAEEGEQEGEEGEAEMEEDNGEEEEEQPEEGEGEAVEEEEPAAEEGIVEEDPEEDYDNEDDMADPDDFIMVEDRQSRKDSNTKVRRMGTNE